MRTHPSRRRRQRGMALLETIVFFHAVVLIWFAGRYFADRWTAVHQSHRAVQAALLDAAHDRPAGDGGSLKGGQQLHIDAPHAIPWNGRTPPLAMIPPLVIDDRLANQRDTQISVVGYATDDAEAPAAWAGDRAFEVPTASLIAPPLGRRSEVPWAGVEAYDRAVSEYTRRLVQPALLAW